MRAQAVRRKREHAHTTHSSKKREKVIMFICVNTLLLPYTICLYVTSIRCVGMIHLLYM